MSSPQKQPGLEQSSQRHLSWAKTFCLVFEWKSLCSEDWCRGSPSRQQSWIWHIWQGTALASHMYESTHTWWINLMLYLFTSRLSQQISSAVKTFQCCTVLLKGHDTPRWHLKLEATSPTAVLPHVVQVVWTWMFWSAADAASVVFHYTTLHRIKPATVASCAHVSSWMPHTCFGFQTSHKLFSSWATWKLCKYLKQNK